MLKWLLKKIGYYKIEYKFIGFDEFSGYRALIIDDKTISPREHSSINVSSEFIRRFAVSILSADEWDYKPKYSDRFQVGKAVTVHTLMRLIEHSAACENTKLVVTTWKSRHDVASVRYDSTPEGEELIIELDTDSA